LPRVLIWSPTLFGGRYQFVHASLFIPLGTLWFLSSCWCISCGCQIRYNTRRAIVVSAAECWSICSFCVLLLRE
jgi:hypothetical protein